MKSKKKLSQINRHALKRFTERFNYPLSIDELKEIQSLIINQKGKLVFWLKGKHEVYQLRWNVFEFYVVFDYNLKIVISFLKMEMILKNDFEELQNTKN